VEASDSKLRDPFASDGNPPEGMDVLGLLAPAVLLVLNAFLGTVHLSSLYLLRIHRGGPVARIQGPIGRFPLLVAVRIDRLTS